MRPRWWFRALVSAPLFACGVPPAGAPVPVEGSAAEIETLAGSWSGRYWSDRGRSTGHGAIRFVLAEGADTARGQVEMTFSPELHLYGEQAERDELQRSPCTTIDITLVRVQADSVRGTLAPYWNPACDCRTVTVFEGRLTDGTVSGAYVTRREGGGAPMATGRWTAERQ
jgi:hypothetical protein